MLCFVDDQNLPGITRKRRGRYWQYFAPDGSRITDRDEIDRLNAIGMPPAYERCWFCPKPNGHIQATGYDAKGRKQYRYHPDFRAEQEAAKYERLAAFGRALPKLRKKVEEDLTGKPTGRETVLAAVVRLIDETQDAGRQRGICEGRTRASGRPPCATATPRSTRGQLKISYAGKHGVKRTVTLTDRNLVRIARRTQDLPGQNLFEYVETRTATSARSPRATSTPISRRRWARSSPPRTSAPGARARSPSRR